MVSLAYFIHAGRTRDWEQHLYCIAKMILILHAGGHRRVTGPFEEVTTSGQAT